MGNTAHHRKSFTLENESLITARIVVNASSLTKVVLATYQLVGGSDSGYASSSNTLG